MKKQLLTLAKKSLPWVRRGAALYQLYLLAEAHQELKAQLATAKPGVERAKVYQRLANHEREMEKAQKLLK